MPLLQGEVSLLTLFADAHYFFGPPNSKPPHHRFDKRSYVYLYHDALNRRGRLEVANHAGTPDQDAFNGYLDTADIEYSVKHPNLFTITVQGRILSSASPAPSPQQDISQWHLPALDPRNEAKYKYRLHTVDLYFWTAEDASLFLDSLKRVLAPGQLRILDANTAHPEHRDSMSPVIQHLEKVAITQPPRSNSISTTHTAPSAGPASASSAAALQTPVSPPSSPPSEQQQAASFAPAAYNPAAPAAPEPIAHREKTPPPPDAEGGTGLGAVAIQDQAPQVQQYGQNQQFGPQPTSGPYRPGMTGLPPPPPPNQGLQRANTFGQTAGSPAGPPQSPYGATFAPPPVDPNAHLYGQQQQTPSPGLVRQSTLPLGYTGYPAQQPQQAQYAQHPNTYGTPTPGAVPTTPSYSATGGLPSPGLYQTQQPQQYVPVQQQYVPAEQYAQQAYDPNMINNPLHQQLYRPEGAPGSTPPAKPGPGQAAATGKAEKRVEKLEKSVNRFFKRIDK